MAKKSTAVLSRKALFTAILAITLGTLTSGKLLWLLLLFSLLVPLCAVLSLFCFLCFYKSFSVLFTSIYPSVNFLGNLGTLLLI